MAVIDTIEEFGHFIYNKSNDSFVVNHDSQSIYLKSLIYAAGHNRHARKIKGYICTKDGQSGHLFLDNLALDETSLIPCETNYGKYIILFNQAKGAITYTNYDKGFYDILSKIKFNYRDDKRWFTCCKNPKVRFQDFVWVYYHTSNVNWDNVFDKIEEFKKSCCAGKEQINYITIDHKDANRFNNCIENLQLLPHYLNSKKSNCTRKLQRNCFYKPLIGAEILGKTKPIAPLFETLNNSIGIKAFDYDLCRIEDKDKGEAEIIELVNFCKTGAMPIGATKFQIGTLASFIYWNSSVTKVLKSELSNLKIRIAKLR